MTDIKIRKAQGKWSVRSGGAILGESTNALELSEGSLEPVIYFPREDIAMALLDRTDHVTHCPHKGDATHFSIANKSATIPNAAWSYEDPIADMSRINGHIAFYRRDDVTVEQI
ncbi:DUF427 domain-containing protein [Primorskyibacter sp. S87]|uniref:DUF427 domain-containing protein n=1 Tax=Primorskyibacter sp. S87 TaxID=3415126 RepID=UPI003C7A76E7